MKVFFRGCAVVGWVLGITLMTVSSAYGTEVLRGWALLCGLGGSVAAIGVIVQYVTEHEQERNERLIEAVAYRFAVEETVHPIVAALPRRH